MHIFRLPPVLPGKLFCQVNHLPPRQNVFQNSIYAPLAPRHNNMSQPLPPTKKTDRICMKFSSTLNVSVQMCFISIFLNQHPLFLLASISFAGYLNLQVRINKMVNKYSVTLSPYGYIL